VPSLGGPGEDEEENIKEKREKEATKIRYARCRYQPSTGWG
jgi:hypothetical protein